MWLQVAAVAELQALLVQTIAAAKFRVASTLSATDDPRRCHEALTLRQSHEVKEQSVVCRGGSTPTETV